MSLTVSPAIPLRQAPADNITVISNPAEDRVVLVVKQRGIVSAALELDAAGARSLRAALATKTP